MLIDANVNVIQKVTDYFYYLFVELEIFFGEMSIKQC